jgi:nucleoid-associated protein YgaU
VASLSAHLTAGAEHGRLGFHSGCPRCREERLAGSVDREPLVSRRAQAALAAGVLAVSTVTPTVSLAAEPDQEQEGGAAPSPDGGTGGTLDDPGFDPGGEDTTLEVDTGALSGSPEAGSDVDEGAEAAPVEGEEQDDADGRLVLSEQPAATVPTDGGPAPAAGPAPLLTDPTAETEPQPAPPAAGQLVERGEARREPARRIVPVAPAPAKKGGERPAASAPTTPTAPSPTVQPPVSVEHLPVSQPATGDTAPVRGDSYTVRHGDSLWSIARRLLGADASNGQVAREVNRLWQLNEERIGTGDPSRLHVGTLLKLR